jgi:hypothetical protein
VIHLSFFSIMPGLPMSADDDDQKTTNEVVGEDEQKKEEYDVTTSSGLPTKKGIQWHSRDSIEVIKKISRVSEYSLDEIIAVWGDDDEAILHKQELRAAAKDVQHGRRVSDNMTFSTTGLKFLVGAAREEKQEAKYKAWDAVMDEQDLQYDEGRGRDSELIAGAYSMTTAEPSEKAHLEALKMQEEVRKH